VTSYRFELVPHVVKVKEQYAPAMELSFRNIEGTELIKVLIFDRQDLLMPTAEEALTRAQNDISTIDEATPDRYEGELSDLVIEEMKRLHYNLNPNVSQLDDNSPSSLH